MLINTSTPSKQLSPTITYRKALSNLIKEAWPFLATRAVELLTDYLSVILLDTNEDILAAISLITSMQVILRSVNVTFLFDTSFQAREAKKSNNPQRLSDVLQASYLFAIALSVLSIPVAVYSASIFELIGESSGPSRIAQDYLRAYAVGIPLMLMSISDQQMFLGLGKPLHVLLVTALARPLTLVFGYCLMHGKYGFPKLGVAGMGYGNAISYAFAFAASTGLLFALKEYRQYDMWKISRKETYQMLKTLMRNGLSIGIYAALELGIISASTMLLGRLRSSYLAAAQPALQYSSILANMTYAFASIVGMVIKGSLAEKYFADAKIYGIAGTAVCSIVPTVVTLVFLVTDHLFLKPFSDTTSIAHTLLLIALLGQIADGLRNACGGVLRGYGDPKSAMQANLLSTLLINLPLAFMFAFVFESPAGILGARSIAITVSTLLLLAKCIKTVLSQEPTNEKVAGIKYNYPRFFAQNPFKKCWHSVFAKKPEVKPLLNTSQEYKQYTL